jgi:hypothetical protein
MMKMSVKQVSKTAKNFILSDYHRIQDAKAAVSRPKKIILIQHELRVVTMSSSMFDFLMAFQSYLQLCGGHEVGALHQVFLVPPIAFGLGPRLPTK